MPSRKNRVIAIATNNALKEGYEEADNKPSAQPSKHWKVRVILNKSRTRDETEGVELSVAPQLKRYLNQYMTCSKACSDVRKTTTTTGHHARHVQIKKRQRWVYH